MLSETKHLALGLYMRLCEIAFIPVLFPYGQRPKGSGL